MSESLMKINKSKNIFDILKIPSSFEEITPKLL